MAGMLQIITYLQAVYLVHASSRENREGMILVGVVVLVACIAAAIGFVLMQDGQARSIGRATFP
jgi:hypothetical protein